ncbi:DUF6912 family protein [Kineococcus indalonis]|uniref:DUF6912 family protein n=1 Tax=Kineococcus indalonis TaxID=2696566 RepID=UPI001411D505|nr:hypothetical protein [Kineococcus indalonis]NAZ85408.1 hypothetical protein [Kineococcus indalonis]
MRVYWPTTLPALAAAAPSGLLAVAPATAHAVTPVLREYYADADPRELEEELEYVAMSDAAEQSLRLLAAAPDGGAPRRVVLALDVPGPAAPRPDAGWLAPGRSRVVLEQDLTLAALVSVHVDDAEAEADVRAALAALPAADAGDEDARFTVESVEGHELLWYDATELSLLLAVGA